MHIGKGYTLFEFLSWTRRSIFRLVLLSAIPTLLYEVFCWKWLAIPWQVVALLGTATAFIVGFKNSQTYNRTWEARSVWGATISATRSWVLMCRDYIEDAEKAQVIIDRHLAWLTVLRYQLRAPKAWEGINKSYNREYQKFYVIPEREIPLEEELSNYMTQEELQNLLSKNNKAVQLLSDQGKALKGLCEDGLLEHLRFLQMHEALRGFLVHQGKNERIKNFPYPRQYATINDLFVKLFCVLLPFALLGEFGTIHYEVSGIGKMNMTWMVIPFSVLISWVYTSLEQVGESTENPFEGNANDVPISQMSRAVEIDIREMLGKQDLPSALQPQNNIIL